MSFGCRVHRRILRNASLPALALLMGGCDLSPFYEAPAVTAPAAYKEQAAAAGSAGGADWHPARPQDELPRGAWWRIFGDSTLDGLEDRASAANQDIKAAIARLDQARAVAAIARAAYYPTVGVNADGTRNQISRDIANTRPANLYNDFAASGQVSYEADLWGRVRNSVANAERLAEASAADLASLQLSLQAELATDYFMLRGDDSQQRVLDTTVQDNERAYTLTLNRFKGGAAAAADVDQAETQLQTVRTQAADTRLKRTQLEHAIAVLTGVPPAQLALAPAIVNTPPPPIPVSLPATLLQRRPDIAAAERRVAAANANIGVARAAFYPSLTLSADFGFEAKSLGDLFALPSRIWSFGPSAAFTLFDAGERNAATDEAHAQFNEAAANYRQTVLSAYGEVEDNLAALRLLAEEGNSQQAGVAAANRALIQARHRYLGGIATYLEVSSAQATLLQAEIASVDVATRRMNAAVALVKAVGGGWQADQDLDLMKSPTTLASADAP